MPQAGVLNSSNWTEIWCPINYKTQEMACNHFSLSKLVQRKSQQPLHELSISMELLTAALKQMNEKRMMTTLIEKAEETEKSEEATSDDTQKSDAEFESKPVRCEFDAVKPRSKQLYDVNEFKSDKGTEDQRTVPIYNFGNSLKKMYLDEKEEEEKSNKDVADAPAPSIPLDYDSDSGLKKVQPYKPLRKIKSLPELKRGNYSWDSEGMVNGQARSITDLSRNWKQQNMELQRGPGYAFLASVADNLISKKRQKASLRSEAIMVKDKGHSLVEIDQSEKEVTIQVQDKPEFKVEAAPVGITEAPEKKRSIFKSVQEWGIKRQTVVTKREINMYMPTSF